MKKWVCSICGYVFEGDAAPEFCPVCKAPADKVPHPPGTPGMSPRFSLGGLGAVSGG